MHDWHVERVPRAMHFQNDAEVSCSHTLSWVIISHRFLWKQRLLAPSDVNPAVHSLGWWHGRIHLPKSHEHHLQIASLPKAGGARSRPGAHHPETKTQVRQCWGGGWRAAHTKTKDNSVKKTIEKVSSRCRVWQWAQWGRRTTQESSNRVLGSWLDLWWWQR